MIATEIQIFKDRKRVPPAGIIQQWLIEVDDQKATLEDMLQHALRRKRIKCCGCGKYHQVGKLTFIQTHWYVRPHGCSGGDYWNQGEGQYDCPSCGSRQREFHEPKIKELKYSFKEIVDEHKHT